MCAIPRDNTSKSTIKQKLSFTPVHTPVLSLLPRARAVRIDLHLVAGVAHQQAAKGSAGRQQAASLHVAGVRCCLFFFLRERKMLFVN